MKRVLITGVNSFVGTSFEQYIKSRNNKEIVIDTLDMIDDNWRKKDFSIYDSVFHVAGIAHSDTGKVSEEVKRKYYKVNTELTIETAKKAKAEGVRQFIFMSSAIVFGDSAPIGQQKIITRDTKVDPTNFYGDSKVQAENGLFDLIDGGFKVVILRPPMIYGKNSKGNYPILSKLAKKMFFFPFVNNSRSMLYIENLCEFIRLMIINEENGVFYPQNAEFVNTSLMVKTIRKINNKKTCLIYGFSWLIKFVGLFTGLVNKAFGNLIYSKDISEYKVNYCIIDFKTSIERTENNE